MVFVPVTVTSMTGIPASHAGVHPVETGTARARVAILSAVATSAGTLTTATGAADAFSAGFIGAAVMAGAVALFAAVRMPAEHASGGAGHMHMH